MTVLVRLCDTRTGETKDIHQQYPDGYSDEGMEFYYTEGNMSCDCNRGPLFHGKEQPQGTLPCYPGNVIRLDELGWWKDGTYAPLYISPNL